MFTFEWVFFFNSVLSFSSCLFLFLLVSFFSFVLCDFHFDHVFYSKLIFFLFLLSFPFFILWKGGGKKGGGGLMIIEYRPSAAEGR